VFSGNKMRCAPLLEQYLVKPKGTLIGLVRILLLAAFSF